MLFLLFRLGEDRYALEASRVVEVIPLLALKPLPQAPKGVAGLFNYRGQPVLALDLSELTIGCPSRERLSTRIFVVRFVERDQKPRLLGLVAEHATEMLQTDAAGFVEPDVTVGRAPFLGPVLMHPLGPIQWLRPHALLTDPVRGLLYPNPTLECAPVSTSTPQAEP